MIVKREELAPGVGLTAIQSDKFKSATLSVTLLTPLKAEDASVNALVPAVLRRGCVAYPTMDRVSVRLEELYGGSLEPLARKRGETQCVGLVGSFLDDAYTLEGESVLEPAAQLTAQLLLEPVTEHGIFLEDHVAGERENLLQAIRSQMNDKRSYATLRLTQEMCAEEPFGVDRLGDEERAAAITAQSAWGAYERLLATAQVELHYCGSADAERVKRALTPLVDGLRARRGEELAELDCEVRCNAEGEEPWQVVDHLDVTQGKLAMGFRTGGACVWQDNYPALLVFSALYGGTATSKLFLNVREKLSLCYYASSALEPIKGIMVVSSGVEFDKMEEAQVEILAQLDAVKQKDFTEDELTSAKQAVINSYRSTLDSRAQLERYWLDAAITGLTEPPEELIARLERVSAGEVAQVAAAMELDTVYRLMGKEG